MATNTGGWLYEANGTPVDKATADNAQARVLEIKQSADTASTDAAKALQTANAYAGQIAQANTTAGSAVTIARGAEGTADNAASRVDALEVMGGVQPGSVNDAEMKLHAEQEGGLFNTALNAQIARAGVLNMDDWGLVGNGVADDTAAFQAAADYAHNIGATLKGERDYRISAPVTVRSGIDLTGTVRVNSATTGRIILARSTPAQTITPSGITGLVAGSRKVAGLPGAGTLSIISTEHLITRHPTGQGGYTKNECVRVLTDGTVSPPLEHTYNPALISELRFWPDEIAPRIKGARVVVDGSTSGSNFLSVSLTAANLVDCGVVNKSTGTLDTGIRVSDSADLTFTNPEASGFMQSGGGYAILLDRTCNTIFNTPRLGLARHAIAGRHNNGIIVNGGTLHGGFDTHWGGRVALNNVVSYIPDGHATIDHVLAAGKGDVTVNGGEFHGGRSIVSLRVDTPTLDGTVQIGGGAVFRPAETLTSTGISDRAAFLGGAADNPWGAFNFDHPMPQPTVKVQDVTVHAAASNPAHAIYVPVTTFPRGPYHMDVRAVAFTGGSTVYAVRHGDNTVSPSATSTIRVEQVTRDSPTSVAVRVMGKSGTISSFSMDVEILENRHPINFTFEKDVPTYWTIKNSVVISINADTATVPVTGNRAELIQCTIRNAWFGAAWTAEFVDCKWEGGITQGSEPTPINDRCRTYSGRRAVGVTGAPTHADGYKNPAYYT